MSYQPIANPLPASQSGTWTITVSGAPTALGQATMANSSPVAIASNQSAIPVSGSVTANIGTSGSLALDATLTGGTQQSKITDGTTVATVKAASTSAGATDKALVVAVSPNNSVAVTLAANTPTLQAGTAVVGKVGIDQTTPGTSNLVALAANQSVNNAQIGGVAVAVGSGVTGTGVQRMTLATDVALPAGTNTLGTTTGPTLTKGTQGSSGYSVQHLHDAGRSAICMTAEFTFAQVAETLLTMTLSADGAATTTFSSRTITSGKKFRIQSIHMAVESLGSGTTPQRAYLRLRRNTAGATVAGSPLQAIWSCINSTAIVKSGAVMDYEYPDGLEMNGDGTATFGFTLETPDWVTSTATGRAKITVVGFEY